MKQGFTASPAGSHRRLYSETGIIDKSFESLPRVKEIQRIAESDIESDTESEISGDLLAEETLSQEGLLDNTAGPSVYTSITVESKQTKEPTSLYDYWKMLLYLYSEARLGPSKIGILDVSRYSHCQLEDSFLELLDEVLGLSQRHTWLWTQSLFFARPFANYFARPIINRFALSCFFLYLLVL